MKRFVGLLGLAAFVATSLGCASCGCPKCSNRGAACGPQCGPGQHCGLGGPGGGGLGQGGLHERMHGGMGPPTPTVVYPYYTTRGPRDFLDPNPRSIGP